MAELGALTPEQNSIVSHVVADMVRSGVAGVKLVKAREALINEMHAINSQTAQSALRLMRNN